MLFVGLSMQSMMLCYFELIYETVVALRSRFHLYHFDGQFRESLEEANKGSGANSKSIMAILKRLASRETEVQTAMPA